jgi:predicted nucleotide-binding protein
MSFADNPLIRRTLAPQPSPDPHAEPRERLWNALRQFRERAAMLANEIHRDLPDFTVHDITHLDALWEMADLIAGPDYPLNPLEAFALGAVFLLHDLGLGLAAWPGGLAEIKKGPGWQDALATSLRKHLERTATESASLPPEVEHIAVEERLRTLHAEHAERLALASWYDKERGLEYHLIDRPDLRKAIGPLLGKIAHSHCWPASRLGSEFETIRGALPSCPRDWTLDPIKIAVLLRTADAAYLDVRREPGFLIALRLSEGISKKHWRFQNHLLKPRVEEDRLVYTTARPFPPEEVDAWWLCEETLRMVDRELHEVDVLLTYLLRSRLRVRGVAGIESPSRLQRYIEVSGWAPVRARPNIYDSDRNLKQLNSRKIDGINPPVVPQEMIQNISRVIFTDALSAVDSVTARGSATAVSRRVFVVHGHDELSKLDVMRTLERLGLEAVVLHEQPNKGKTIVEKFEDNAVGVVFAVVLLTPDDEGYPIKTPDQKRARARQNVILELGYFLASLGRGKVCVLYRGDVEIPSDYLGVIYTPMDDAGFWRFQLGKEMKAAGVEIDVNRILQ